MGASDAVIATEETPPSYAESWRTVQKIESLKRIWWSLPFLATALIGFVTLASLMYEQEFGLDDRARGIASAIAEPFQLVGLVLGSRIITRRYLNNMRGLIRFLAKVAVGTSLAAIVFAISPNIAVAVAANSVISAALAMLGPGILVALALAIPPRARATGFSVASLWVIPGLVVLPIIGWISGHVGIRWGMLVLVPLFIIGSLILGSAGSVIDADIAQVWPPRHAARPLSTPTGPDRSVARTRRRCRLWRTPGVVRRRHRHQGGRDRRAPWYERRRQEHAAEGDQRCGRGGSRAVVLDGRDITHAPPNEIAGLGISQMPGGQGVFGSLTVAENLRLAGWTRERTHDAESAITEVLTTFPALRERLTDSAADLSGGQQQMLALGMAFIAKPRVLLIDELSLGLAPVVVGQLLPLVRRLADDGVAVILVEQSVNVALTLAERAYFMGAAPFDSPARPPSC
jgi:branched-chain amino acid transport system ATP-binding protein